MIVGDEILKRINWKDRRCAQLIEVILTGRMEDEIIGVKEVRD